MTEQEIAIALLPSLIERASIVTRHGVTTNFEFNHEQIVAQAYKFAKEIVRHGGGE